MLSSSLEQEKADEAFGYKAGLFTFAAKKQ